MTKEQSAVVRELAQVQVLFQARAIAAAMGLPQPTQLDNRPDGSGIDDGPYLPGCAPRKPLPVKTAEEHAATRAKAWATRRARTLSHPREAKETSCD